MRFFTGLLLSKHIFISNERALCNDYYFLNILARRLIDVSCLIRAYLFKQTRSPLSSKVIHLTVLSLRSCEALLYLCAKKNLHYIFFLGTLGIYI